MALRTLTHGGKQRIQTKRDAEDLAAGKLVSYIQCRRNTCRSYRGEFNVMKEFERYAQVMKGRRTFQVWAEAETGDLEACLELGLRMYTGCETTQDRDGAVTYWTRIICTSGDNVPRATLARALACMAMAWFDKRIVAEGIKNIDSLYRAAMFADKAAALGLVAPIVLVIANIIEHQGFRRRHDGLEDCTSDGMCVARLERLQFLWRVSDERNAEIAEMDRKRETKVEKKGRNYYVCAAEDCGIEATTKSSLMSCAGRCPLEIKPSYCNKQCQRKDWKRHKPFCRPDARTDVDDYQMTKHLDDDDDERLQLSTLLSDEIGPEHFNTDGKERTIDIQVPGMDKAYKLASKTMSPEWMRELRNQVANMALDENHSKEAELGRRTGKQRLLAS